MAGVFSIEGFNALPPRRKLSIVLLSTAIAAACVLLFADDGKYLVMQIRFSQKLLLARAISNDK